MSAIYSKEDVVEKLLLRIKAIRDFWLYEDQSDDVKTKIDGFIFSLLNMFDGGTIDIPHLNISCDPHPCDKEFCVSNEQDYFEPGQVINDDCSLHDLWLSIK